VSGAQKQPPRGPARRRVRAVDDAETSCAAPERRPQPRWVDGPALPLTALGLAASWILAQAVHAPLLAAWVAAAALTAAGLLAVRRRRRSVHVTGVLLLGSAVAAALLLLLTCDPGPPFGFFLLLLFVAVLGPLAPLLYAIAFDPPNPEDEG